MTFTTTFMKVETPNLNERIYTLGAMEGALKDIQGPLLGTIGMPPTLNVDLSDASHRCDNFRITEDGSVTCDVTILDTERGAVLRDLIERPGTGFRTAGYATTEQNGGVCVITEFTISSVNFVLDPA